MSLDLISLLSMITLTYTIFFHNNFDLMNPLKAKHPR